MSRGKMHLTFPINAGRGSAFGLLLLLLLHPPLIRLSCRCWLDAPSRNARRSLPLLKALDATSRWRLSGRGRCWRCVCCSYCRRHWSRWCFLRQRCGESKYWRWWSGSSSSAANRTLANHISPTIPIAAHNNASPNGGTIAAAAVGNTTKVVLRTAQI